MKRLFACFLIITLCAPVYGQKKSGSSSSSKPPSSSSKSSGSSSSSKPPSSSSKSSGSSSKPASGFSSPNSSKSDPPKSPASGFSAPNKSSNPPKSPASGFSAPNSNNSEPSKSSGFSAPSAKVDPPKNTNSGFSSPNSGVSKKPTGDSGFDSKQTPAVPPATELSGSKKPSSSSGSQLSEKARANNMQRSERDFVQTKKAIDPPKSTYVAPNGKTAPIPKEAPTVAKIRSKPSTEITPERRTQNINVHFNTYGYRNPYSYYTSQPYIYVGNGYSSAFYWMMLNEWDAERRARWLYNNRDTIERDAYDRGVQDAQVQARIAQLEAEKAARDASYVDAEFANDPELMYDQEFVEAAYNPIPAPAPVADAPDNAKALKVLGWVLAFGVIVLAVVAMFSIRIGK